MAENDDKKCTCTGPVRAGQGPVTKQPKSGGQTGHRDRRSRRAALSQTNSMGSRATAPRAMPGRIGSAKCERIVAEPVDFSPERSPQAVHTAMLSVIAGRDVAEIGTRRGDGITCFAQVATQTTAIEVRPEYCKMLEQRSRQRATEGEHGFTVLCREFQQAATIEADVILWWQGKPYLENRDALCKLRTMQTRGSVRARA